MGRVGPITACDPACASAVAWLLPALSAEATAAFLRDLLAPLYQRAGWPLQRVLTDGGSEFTGACAATCQALGSRHTRTQPRHAGTNGFVERLPATILPAPGRLEFRRRSLTSRAAMQRSREAFVRVSHERRPPPGLPAGWSDARRALLGRPGQELTGMTRSGKLPVSTPFRVLTP